MDNILFRLGNCFSLSNIIALSFGAGLAVVGIFAPIGWPDFPKEVAQLLTFIGIGLVVLGLVLAAWKYLRNPIEKRLKQYSIINTLDSMYKRLETMACKESQKVLDLVNFAGAAAKIIQYAGVTVPIVSTMDDAKDSIELLEKEIPTLFPKDKNRTQRIRKLLSLSRLLDREGFGLKEKRTGDRQYTKLSKSLDKYFDNLKDVIDNRLRILIRAHVDYTESATNALVFIKRTDTMLKTLPIEGISDILPLSFQAGMEGFDVDAREIARKIRVEIGQHIKKIGG